MMLGMSLALTQPGGGVVDPAAVALFAAMSTPPTAARKVLINNTIRSLKAAGVWSRLGALHVMAAETQQAGLVNWINPAQVATISGTMTFVADRGNTGNGTDGTVATGIAINALPNLSLNDATTLAWCLTDVGINAKFDVGASGSSTLGLNTRSGGNAVGASVNSAQNAAAAAATSVGLTAAGRVGSSNISVYKNGSSILGTAQVSTTLGAGNLMYASSNGTGFSTRQLAICGAGGGMTATQHAALYSILLAFLQAIGAA